MCGGSGGSMIGSKAQAAREADYQAEDDMRQLERAHEISAAPHRMKHVRRFAKKRASTLQQIALGKQGFLKGKR